MTWVSAVLLGILEGLTEFLPVSSTGHLILAKRFLGLQGEGVNSFLVVIQLGALFAAILYYRKVLWQILVGVVSGKPESRRIFLALCVGALPLLLLGYFFGHHIKDKLFGSFSVSLALVIGGLVMIGADFLYQKKKHLISLTEIPIVRACIIGVIQACALIPGTSRSMSCIVGGQVVGMDRVSAADFAFLLAIPTLGIATVYELIKSRHELSEQVGMIPILIGLCVSFLVGFLVIAGFLRYLRRFGLAPFGIYRIVLGLGILAVERFW